MDALVCSAMRTQRLKDTYYQTMRPIARLNGYLWSARLLLNRHRVHDPCFLNLGCGDKYAKGFLNVDGNVFRKKDLWLDLRNGLPWLDCSVDAIYACHVFEHFYASELRDILQDCHRILKPRGGIRILVPSLEQAISAYVAGNKVWFPDFPSSYESIGGRFFNYVFCDSQHRVTFDFSFLNELLHDARFRRVTATEPGKSNLFSSDALAGVEHAEEPYVQTSLLVEAFKD
jgi:predicted SAM-dependent methyltransferase